MRPVPRLALVALMLAGLALCVVVFVRSLASASVQWHWQNSAIALLLLCGLAGLVVAAGLWKSLTRKAGVQVTWKRSFVGLGALLVGKYLPGKVFGMVGRAASLGAGTGKLRATALVVAEQAFVLAGVVVVTLLALAFGKGRIELALAAAATVALASALPTLVGVAVRRWGSPTRLPLAMEYSDIAQRAGITGSTGLLFLAILLANCVLAAAAFVPGLLGIEVTLRQQGLLVGYYGLAVLAGSAVIFLPGGIGARELGFVALSSSMLGNDQAVAVAASLRLVSVTIDVFAGLLALLVARTGLED